MRFQAAIDDAIEHIRERPGSWPRFAGNTRRYLLRGFPYAVIYREQGDAIQILAFAHLRRRPNYWRGRE